MTDDLRLFIKKYKKVMTVEMLTDLCDALKISPSTLTSLNNSSTMIGQNNSPTLVNQNNIAALINQIKALISQNKTLISQNKIFRNNDLKVPENKTIERNAEHSHKKYFTCEEIAEKYGVKKITVWSWIRGKKLNAIRTGRDYRIRPEDIQEFNETRFTK